MLAAPDAKPEEARTRLQKIVKKNPERATAYLEWAKSLSWQDQYVEAEEVYAQAAQAAPSSGEVYLNWADALFNQGKSKYPGAIGKYLKAIESGKAEEVNYSQWNIAVEALPASEQNAFGEDLQALVNDEPQRSAAYLGWGEELYEQKKYAGAADKYRRAAQAQSISAKYHAHWGDALYQQGNDHYATALEQYLKAIEIDSDSIDYGAFVSILQTLPQSKQVIIHQALQEFTTNDPQKVAIYVRWGTVLRDAKQFEKADEKYREALRINPDFARAHNALARSLVSQEKYRDAVESFLTGAALDPLGGVDRADG